jgi:hypothetical protein
MAKIPTTAEPQTQATPQQQASVQPLAQGQDTKTTAAARNWFQNQARGMRAELRSSVTSSQAGATVITNTHALVNQSVPNGSFVLRSIASQDAADGVFVMNLSGQTIKVYPATGEALNGSANAAQSIGDGQLGIFFAYGNYAAAAPEWRSAVVT